ncbi:DNA-binding protein [Paralcaligenes sp. KSB-10]|uniref:PCC domain-containing protein n=1 Tax=Paralcaligenes sp. KSB-10 TaxID=2901142 RepID=UPI001E45DF51|nr:DUF296 domain-containing protein [Paralcaligenes sp. KSB-10]UHL66127.1 DNA-binding protein [Paralcaligenes sp. KSB-10]
MRHIEHPGPVAAERLQCIDGKVDIVELVLGAGQPLMAAATQALSALGASSAVLTLHDGALDPFAYVLPAMSDSPEHAVYYSKRYDAPPGQTHIQAGCITYGLRDHAPWLHCHALWNEADGTQRCGHILPDDAILSTPLHATAALIRGVDFVVAADAETNFSLFQPQLQAQPQGLPAPEPELMPGSSANGVSAFVLRVRPNQDFCTALETICTERGIRRAIVRGGVGSLVGAAFDDGRTVAPIATEVFIQRGIVEPGADGAAQATVDVVMVDYTGATTQGRLLRGANAVLVTFELVVEPLP